VLVDVDGGSVPHGEVAVTHISGLLYPALTRATVGAHMIAAGLFETGTPGVYGLRDSGTVRLD
jgi:hypothetical protein